jgi:DNA-binding response OmpR family regulator
LPSKRRILVVSHDPKLADVRKHLLERAGFIVLQAMNAEKVAEACRRSKLNLVMIGYSVPPAEKRRAWQEARKVCKTPVLELYRDGKPELMDDSAMLHRSHTVDDFLEAVSAIFSPPRVRRGRQMPDRTN